MTENKQEELQIFFQNIQCQFLCCYPVRNIDWQSFPELTWTQQQQLIDTTYGHPLNKEYPVKLAYQLNFLKRLLQTLEQSNTEEVHDDVYESYCAVQQQLAEDATQKYAYKHYLLPRCQRSTKFTLRESKSFVAEGTTGLCSWQASLALADYLLHNAHIVRHKNVLELGAGTGLCGFIISRCCGAQQVLLTDGAKECMELMQENFKKNFPTALEESNGCYRVAEQTLEVKQLQWQAIEENIDVRKLQPEVLLAADVVYDDSVFDELTHAIDFVFEQMQNSCNMLLAATVRNEHTLQKFLCLLENLQFHIEEQRIVPLEESHLFWDRTTPVRILLITRK